MYTVKCVRISWPLPVKKNSSGAVVVCVEQFFNKNS